MSNASPAKEPSMEEILASIRRIIESGDERPVLGSLGARSREKSVTSIPSPGAEANDRVVSGRTEVSNVPDLGTPETGRHRHSTGMQLDAMQAAGPPPREILPLETATRETVARAERGRERSIENTDAASSLESAVDPALSGIEDPRSSRLPGPGIDVVEALPAAILAWPRAERAMHVEHPAVLDVDVELAESRSRPLTRSSHVRPSLDQAAIVTPPSASLAGANPSSGLASDGASSSPGSGIALESPGIDEGAPLAGPSSPPAASTETQDFSMEFDEESFSAELSGEFGSDAFPVDAAQPKGAKPAEGREESAEVAPPASVMAETSSLMSQEAGAQVAAAFDDLARAIRDGQMKSMEDMAREMLRPMLQDWLDDNLPRLVEKLVREEIERVARGPRR